VKAFGPAAALLAAAGLLACTPSSSTSAPRPPRVVRPSIATGGTGAYCVHGGALV
jgi:hypothetical protein